MSVTTHNPPYAIFPICTYNHKMSFLLLWMLFKWYDNLTTTNWKNVIQMTLEYFYLIHLNNHKNSSHHFILVIVHFPFQSVTLRWMYFIQLDSFSSIYYCRESVNLAHVIENLQSLSLYPATIIQGYTTI